MVHKGLYSIGSIVVGAVALSMVYLWPSNPSNAAIRPYTHPAMKATKFRDQLVDPTSVSRIMFGGGPTPLQRQWPVPPQLTPVVARQIITLLGRGVPLMVHLPVPNRPHVQHVPYYVILYLTNGRTVAVVSATHDPWEHLNVPLQQIPDVVTYTNQRGQMVWVNDPPLYQWLAHKYWTKYLRT